MYKHVNDDEIKTALREFRNCFRLFNNNGQLYSKAGEKTDCSNQAKQLVAVTKKNIERDPLFSLFFLQAALTIFNGEHYYHSLRNRVDAWNIRDNHMAESIKRIAQVKGKVIVWLHNTHAGDAFYSSTHWHARSSVGEILRKSMGEKNIYLVGFGTYSGTVTAAQSWGGNIEQMQLANAELGTWEQTLHSKGAYDKYIMLDETKDNRQLQTRWIYTRSIGVLYHSNERSGMNLSLMAKRFDAYIFIDHTTALHPLQVKVRRTAGKIED
jgi:erythromycin esterase